MRRVYVLEHVHVALLIAKGVSRRGTDVWAKNRRTQCGAMCWTDLGGWQGGCVWGGVEGLV